MTSSSVAFIRQKLGLTQQALAEYLNIDRSLLSKIEKNNRQMSHAVHMAFLELVQMYEQAAKERIHTGTSEQEEVKVQQFRQKQVQELEWRLLLTERKLSQMQQQYHDALLQLHAFGLANQYLKTNPAEEVERKLYWCSRCQQDIQVWLKECDLTAQESLISKIEGLQQQVNLIKKRLIEKPIN